MESENNSNIENNGAQLPENVPTKKRNVISWIILGIVSLFLTGITYLLFIPNVDIQSDKDYFYIPTGTNYSMFIWKLNEKNCLRDMGSFKFLTELAGYPEQIRAGKYPIYDGMSNFALLRMLYGGQQEPVKFRFESFRTPQDLAQLVEKQLEMSGTDFLLTLADARVLDSLGFKQKDYLNLFIPNTYEMYWNITPTVLLQRMKSEYERFWNIERLQKAKVLGLTPLEVGTLASIVQGETYRDDERARVAGVYFNRLKTNMPLQADPTVIFAVGDFTIKRVLNKHLQIDSPYNTYKYSGLPPGPINAPSISSIDAVLNYEKHQYLYFCAKNDNSGYHHFSRFYEDHIRYAKEYHNWVSKMDAVK